MTVQEFFASLNDGEEYFSLLCDKDTYIEIPQELMTYIVVNSIRQKNESFKDDEAHKELVKKLRKAKKELQDYEYDKNNYSLKIR